MNEIQKSKTQADEARLDVKTDSVMLKLLGYLLALVIGGAIVCFVMGLIKTAIDSLIIVGACLLVVAIIIVWIYHSTKWHIREKQYKRVLKDYKAQDGDTDK